MARVLVCERCWRRTHSRAGIKDGDSFIRVCPDCWHADPANETVDAKKARFHRHAAKKLKEIAELLTDDARLTLLARFPGYPDRNLVITNDEDMDAAIEALGDRKRQDGA